MEILKRVWFGDLKCKTLGQKLLVNYFQVIFNVSGSLKGLSALRGAAQTYDAKFTENEYIEQLLSGVQGMMRE